MHTLFEDVILGSTVSSYDECHDAANALASEWLNSNNFLAQLTEQNKEYYETQLENTGISNAHEIIQQNLKLKNEELALNKQYLADKGKELASVSEMERAEFIANAVAAGTCSQQYAAFQLQKILCNNNRLDSTTDINSLTMLAKAAGIAGNTIAQLSSLKAGYDTVKNDPHAAAAINEQIQTLEAQIANEISSIGTGVKFDLGDITFGNSVGIEAQKEADTLADLNSQMDKLQSSYKSLCDIRDTYNKSGKITIDQYQELTDMGFNFLANLVDENGELGLNANAFEQLAGAKLQEMQIQMARNAIDTINGLQSEIEATEYLTYANENLRSAALSVAEALLYRTQDDARMRGEQQGLAADRIVQGYEAAKMLAGKAEFGFDASDMKETLLDAYNEQKKLLDHMKAMGEISNAQYQKQLMDLAENYFDGKEEYRDNLWEVQEQYHDYLESVKKTYSWIENLLSSLSKKTGTLIDKAEKFIFWQKKNSMINAPTKLLYRTGSSFLQAFQN